VLPVSHIHPIVVHFPIVFMLSLVAFDIVALARGATLSGRSWVANLSAGLAALAGLSAIAAFVFGDLAFDAAIKAGFTEAQLEGHEGLGTWTAILIALWAAARVFLWWRGKMLGRTSRFGIAAIEIAGAAMIIATAYLGGQLVYELGVNVAHAAGS
jgi:uncharacterized membrane protein